MNTVSEVTSETRQTSGVLRRVGERLWKGLASHNVALLLMALLLLSLAAQAVLPQEGRIPPLQYAQWRANYPFVAGFVEAVGLQRVAYTPWFWGIGATLAVSLALSIPRRVLRLWRHGPTPKGPVFERSVASGQEDAAQAAKTLRRLGYAVTQEEEVLSARKGVAGPWGSVLFHAGLLVLVVGAFLSAGTRFNGYVEVAPGQLFLPSDPFSQTFNGFLAQGRPDVALSVEDIRLEFWPDGTIKDVHLQARLWNEDGRSSQGTVQRNDTLDLDGVSVTLGSPLGPAVLLQYRRSGDSAPVSGYVHFTEEAGRLLNRFTAPGTETMITAEVVGDWRGVLEEKADAGAVSLVLHTAGADGSRSRMDLERGGSASIEGGEITFAGMRPWTLVMISEDKGLPVMIAGGAAALLGLALALLVPVRWITARRRPEGWTISGRASWATATTRRDVDRLADALAGTP